MHAIRRLFHWSGPLHWFFQNLNESGKRLWEFRGSFTVGKVTFTYSSWSGNRFALGFNSSNGDGDRWSFDFGLIFFTIILGIESRYLGKFGLTPARYDKDGEFIYSPDKDLSIRIFDWAIWIHVWEGTYDSKRGDRKYHLNFLDTLFGRVEVIKDDLISTGNIVFKIGEVEFLMNSIAWYRYRRFRRFIPYSIYHSSSISVDLKIDKPPMRRGKGENSWDCDDDGSFGLHGPWNYEMPTWKNREQCAELAVKYYVDHCMRDTKKYGSTSGPNGVKHDAKFTYIGIVKQNLKESEIANEAEGAPVGTTH
jgi:hypothetical protein